MPEYPENIGSQISAGRNDKNTYARVWDLCTMFLEGRQWLEFDRDRGNYIINRRSRPDGSQRQTVNLLLNIYRNILARLTLSYPSIAVMPASPSNDDIIKAKSSEIALQYYWHREDMESKLHKGIQWLLVTGSVGMHSYYDADEDVIHSEPISPYDIFFEDKVTDPDDSQWIAIRSYHIEEDVKKAYPKYADEIASTQSDSEDASLDAELHTVPDDRVELMEVYWRDGRHAILSGDLYLYKGTWKTKSFPVQFIRYTEVPGRLWGIGLMQPLLDLQRLYNEQRTQVVHNVKLMGNPKWAIPKTAGINSSAMTNRPGEKIYFNPAGGAPQQIQPVPLPGYVLDSLTRTQAEMHDVAGIHSVSLGKRAVGVSSGRAMQVLTEHDTSQLQETQTNIETAIRDLAKVVLELMKEHYSEPKMVRMLDQTGKVVYRAISNENIADDPEVFIEAGSTFRQDARSRDQYVLDLLQAGLITPEQAMREISFRTGNAFVTEKVAAMSHAKKLLEATKRGFEIEIFQSDDIPSMLKVFSDYTHSDEFYTLPEERQLYIRDVVVALSNPMSNDMEFQTAEAMQKVFPRQPSASSTMGQQLANIVAAGSGSTQGQMADESMSRAGQVQALESAQSSQAAGQEAMISPVFGGLG
tara:strand:- start:4755 stop:6674 length:1920 start_codon:yes stop_codon:yes gene_type:complete